MSTDCTSTDSMPRGASRRPPSSHGLSRRNLLLSGTTLAAASALGSVASVRNARAQGPAGWVVVSMKDDWNTIFAEIPK